MTKLGEGTTSAKPGLKFKRRLRFHVLPSYTRTWGIGVDPHLAMANLWLGSRQVMLSWWKEIVQ